jgi:long-chain acyl-CoA synthetase
MRYRHLIERTVRLHRHRVAVLCGDASVSFGELHERACRLGNALAARGLLPGDRVGVLLPNRAEYAEIDIGLAQAGFVRVSLNTRATPHQQCEVLDDAEARALIYDGALADAAAVVLDGVPSIGVAICVGDEPDGGAEEYETALAHASPAPPDADPAPDDLYCLFYTSGTTGRPKGVMLEHGAYHAVALNLLLEFGPVRPGERIVLTQPLSHGGGFFLLPWLISGATCIVMERFDPVGCLELAERHAADAIKVVPTMLLQMLEAGIEPPPLPALRTVIYGASPMPAGRLAELIERFGPLFAQLYGQAEAPMSITVLAREDHAGPLLASAGRAWHGVEVRVVDSDGRDVANGETGEVVVRGPHLMRGYWGLPELTATVLRDGWVHTRDLARQDERGFVFLLGRTDEMIVSGGFNIAPRVVEDVLNRHPAVLESAVTGLPHSTLGQEVAAFVALRPGRELSPAEIVDFTRAELGFQKPRTVRIVERLPRNAYGKVATSELRRLAAGGAP